MAAVPAAAATAAATHLQGLWCRDGIGQGHKQQVDMLHAAGTAATAGAAGRVSRPTGWPYKRQYINNALPPLQPAVAAAGTIPPPLSLQQQLLVLSFCSSSRHPPPLPLLTCRS